ncbi:Ras GTPase-activating-like protein IQGAP1 [Acropora cervicornis]|uniref:Ras GTPase-activating-like protein IQGAP1 n=1 Tax=Acropora cervicornis TaxID=6130 RepID=A0AAD9QNJ2_ACRCE|nr:Ras GTPase-activating-like protein IQGAP1 [Acropora cervicornis]
MNVAMLGLFLFCFRRFFLEVSTVEEPENHFNIDEYTDVIMVTKPAIYISVQEICDTHTLLLDHKDEIAPDPNDPLHELLDDLGDAPSVEALLGESSGVNGEEGLTAQSAKTEIYLTLTNKFEVPEDDDSDMRALFVRTKRVIVDVLKVQPGENLTEILETAASDEQEEEHMRLMKLRELSDENKNKSHGNVSRSASSYGDSKYGLLIISCFLLKPSGAKQQKGKEEVYRGDIKYTAQRLYEKGVILEIEGLPPSQFKNVMFEIKSADEVGMFEVSAKFMGVAMEKVELVFQDLLQLQYEGVAVMKMFGRAKINVNLLIFLLNKKFYGK